MANRTQIVCLHEGEKGRSIDPIFINKIIRTLSPTWIRHFKGSNIVRMVDCGGRAQLIDRMPKELKTCLSMGGKTTLMVWADLDDDMADGDALKDAFWKTAQSSGILRLQFESVVFVFAKDRLENWIQYLIDGATDETVEAPRVKDGSKVAKAAKILADRCKAQQPDPPLPPSLKWSCTNWRKLVAAMS
jgi:hypothetical protein